MCIDKKSIVCIGCVLPIVSSIHLWSWNASPVNKRWGLMYSLGGLESLLKQVFVEQHMGSEARKGVGDKG